MLPGDYAIVYVEEATGHTLRGSAVAKTTLAEYAVLGDDHPGVHELGAVIAASRCREPRSEDSLVRKSKREGGMVPL